MLILAKSSAFVIGIFFIFSIDLCNYAAARDLYEGANCKMKDSTAGVCTKLPECKSIDEALKKRMFSFKDIVLCSFASDVEVICCPDKRVERTPVTKKPSTIGTDVGDGIVLNFSKSSTNLPWETQFSSGRLSSIRTTTVATVKPTSRNRSNENFKSTTDDGFLDLAKLVQSSSSWRSSKMTDEDDSANAFTQSNTRSTRRPSAVIRDLEVTTRWPTTSTTTKEIEFFPNPQQDRNNNDGSERSSNKERQSGGRSPYWSGINWRYRPSTVTEFHSTTNHRPVHSHVDNSIDEPDIVVVPNQNIYSENYSKSNWYTTTQRTTSHHRNNGQNNVNDLESDSDDYKDNWQWPTQNFTQKPIEFSSNSSWHEFVFPSSPTYSSTSTSFSNSDSSVWSSPTTITSTSPQPATNTIPQASSSVLDPWMLDVLSQYQNISTLITTTTSTVRPVVVRPSLPSSLPIIPDIFPSNPNSPEDYNEISPSTRKPNPISPKPTPLSRLSERKSDKVCAQFTEDYVKPIDFHILEGEPTYPGEFPHMAALGYPGAAPGTYDWNCGGTLISDRYVLTAAHCAKRIEVWPALVRLGTIHINETGIDVGVENVILHPEYKGSLQYHDVALIHLNFSVNFTDYIFPACLSSDGSDESGRELVGTGWGAISTQTWEKSGLLLKVKLRTIDLKECNQRHLNYSRNRRVPDGLNQGQICAGDFVGLRRGDTCQGDSGGPLQLVSETALSKIIGITSFGISCGTDIPSVYARVSFYLDWIESKVWPDLI